MSIAAQQAEQRVLLTGVSWSTFEALLVDTKHRGIRFTFDRGSLEMMSPSREHERLKRLLGRMIETTTEEFNIPISSASSTTLKAEWEQRGLEADESYYIANEPKVRGREEIDLRIDPPPDLAIEIDISSSSLNQLSIYADLGVTEVWLYDGATLRIYQLQADHVYTQQTHSPTFPTLSIDEVQRFLDRRNDTDETTWIRSFRAWVKTLGARRVV